MIDRKKIDERINEILKSRIGQLEIDVISGQAHMQIMQERIEELETENEKLKHEIKLPPLKGVTITQPKEVKNEKIAKS
jgi:regulator of replication initiation timing